MLTRQDAPDWIIRDATEADITAVLKLWAESEARPSLTDNEQVVADLLNIKHGFGFSAGLIDFLVNMHLATNGWLLIPVGLVYAVVYFLLFSVLIRTMDLPTPGRTTASGTAEAVPAT